LRELRSVPTTPVTDTDFDRGQVDLPRDYEDAEVGILTQAAADSFRPNADRGRQCVRVLRHVRAASPEQCPGIRNEDAADD
jgi:hypothetical protein